MPGYSFFADTHAFCQVLASVLDAQQIDVNFHDEDGLTSVHYAASYGHTHAIRFLVDYGADVDAPNRKGATPLLVRKAVGFVCSEDAHVSLVCTVGSSERSC
jgi:ankyrin repeat protein